MGESALFDRVVDVEGWSCDGPILVENLTCVVEGVAEMRVYWKYRD